MYFLKENKGTHPLVKRDKLQRASGYLINWMISAGSCGDRPFKSQSGNLAVGGVDSGEIEISFKIGKVEALIELFLGSHPNYYNY